MKHRNATSVSRIFAAFCMVCETSFSCFMFRKEWQFLYETSKRVIFLIFVDLFSLTAKNKLCEMWEVCRGHFVQFFFPQNGCKMSGKCDKCVAGLTWIWFSSQTASNMHWQTLNLFVCSCIFLLNISITHAVLPLTYCARSKILEHTYWTPLVCKLSIRKFFWISYIRGFVRNVCKNFN